MEFAAIQSQRRLQGVLQKKRDEARRRKEAAEKRSRVEAEAKAEAERLEAAAQKKRQVESMLVMIEQGIRTFGYVAGVTTAQIRAFFAATYAGVKINDELFRAALQKGVHDRRLRHGTRRGKLDVNSYLLFEEVIAEAERNPLARALVVAEPLLVYCVSLPCYAVSCYALSCYAMPCHAMPCYAMPCRAVHCYAMLCNAMICYAMQLQSAMQCCAMLCNATQCHAMLCNATQCCAML